MDNNIQQFINSGILEAFISGATTEAEEREVLYMKQHYPVVQQTLSQIEHDMEALAQRMSMQPPPGLWNRIEAELKEVIPAPEPGPLAYRQQNHQNGQQQHTYKKEPDYLEVEAQSSHMRIHKAWKWVFAAVFILGKIFLGFAIYFYLENRQAQQNIQELKQEVKELRAVRGH